MTDEERQEALTELSGTWPKDCPQRAFVEGAAWCLWGEFQTSMFPEEREEAEREAVRRYGEPKSSEVTEWG